MPIEASFYRSLIMSQIDKIVKSFYEKAVKDVLIGYHFRKIQEGDSEDVLNPSLIFFKSHIPRITSFWRAQLLVEKTSLTFDLIKTHAPLRINKGELNRWLMLFHQTLDEYGKSELTDLWKKKLLFFERVFQKRFFTEETW